MNSLLRVDFFDGTMKSWRWGVMRPEFEHEYNASGKAPVVLAAIVWKTLVDLITEAMRQLPLDQALTVRYDTLIHEPEHTLAQMIDFCGLAPSSAFHARVARIHVAGSDDQWKRLPRDERGLLEASLRDHLQLLGFS